jgi:hypothetical protein
LLLLLLLLLLQLLLLPLLQPLFLLHRRLSLLFPALALTTAPVPLTMTMACWMEGKMPVLWAHHGSRPCRPYHGHHQQQHSSGQDPEAIQSNLYIFNNVYLFNSREKERIKKGN